MAQQLTGQRLKVRGQWTGAYLEVDRVQERDQRKDPRRGLVIGAVTEVDPERATFTIGPVRVEWNPRTEWQGLRRSVPAIGDVMKVAGRVRHTRATPAGDGGRAGTRAGRASLVATRVERIDGTPSELEILGAVTASETLPDGRMVVSLLGVPAMIPPETRIRQLNLTRRPDDRRPDEQFRTTLFGRPVIIGGEVGVTARAEEDFTLDDAENDDVFRIEGELELEVLVSMSDAAALFLEGKASSEGRFALEEDADDEETDAERGEMWLYASNLRDSAFSVQVGRQNFVEPREWWWDQDLDAVRVHFDRRFFHAELAVAQELAAVSSMEDGVAPEHDDVLRILGHAAWSWAPDQRSDGFLLYQHDHSRREPVGLIQQKDDRDASDADLLWVGGRLSGDIDLAEDREVNYWVDGAFVTGREALMDFRQAGGDLRRVSGRRRWEVQGWGVDVGATVATSLPLEPAFTVAYAYGSGDGSPDAGTDRAFRQTGLQDNNGRFRGVDRFRYYGELLRPELSNLHIFTAAVGIPLKQSSSVELVYHYYAQDEAAPFLRESSLDAAPTGRDREIGHEWDLVIGLEEWEHWELELIGGVFLSGTGFGPLSGETALLSLLKMNYNF